MGASSDPRYCRLGDPEGFARQTLRHPTANHDDRALFNDHAHSLRPSLRSHVGHVLSVSASEEMVGATAWRIVAGVAYLESIGNRADGETVRDDVGVGPRFPIPDPAVSMLVSLAASPRPASVKVAPIHARPEASSEIRKGACITTSPRTETLRRVTRLAGIGGAEEIDAAPLADQCDTLRGHQVSPIPGARPRIVTSGPGLRRPDCTGTPRVEAA